MVLACLHHSSTFTHTLVYVGSSKINGHLIGMSRRYETEALILLSVMVNTYNTPTVAVKGNGYGHDK